MSYILDREIKYLPGIGEKRAGLLEKELGIRTFGDMLYTFPFRYIDRSKVYSIAEIDSATAYIQLRGRIVRTSAAGEGKGRRLIATLRDESGTIDLVFFKGVKWIQDKISPNKEYIVFGKPSLFNGTWNMVHPELDPVGESGTSSWPSTLIGIYSSTDKLRNNGISVKVFAKLQQTLQQKIQGLIRETLPQEVIAANKLPSLAFALSNIHFPKDIRSLEAARYRLKFEELFFLQLSLLRQKNVRMSGSSGILFPRVGQAFNYCYGKLPYELTGAQKRVIKEIRRDTVSGKQMNRLLQGDVGSGKTMVALLTALIAVDNGYQACVMAPTEVLAVQHFRNFERSLAGSPVRIALLTGSSKAKERREIDAGLRDGSINILIGTHAVIEDNVVSAGPSETQVCRAAAYSGNDGNAHPADPGHDPLRRPGRIRDRRAATGPQAGTDHPYDGGTALQDVRLHKERDSQGTAGIHRLSAYQRVRETRLSEPGRGLSDSRELFPRTGIRDGCRPRPADQREQGPRPTRTRPTT